MTLFNVDLNRRRRKKSRESEKKKFYERCDVSFIFVL